MKKRTGAKTSSRGKGDRKKQAGSRTKGAGSATSAPGPSKKAGTGGSKSGVGNNRERAAAASSRSSKPAAATRQSAPAGTARGKKPDRSQPPAARTSPATSQDPIQFPEERRRKVKTYLTAKQLREFRQLLLEKRAELAGDVERLTDEALHRGDNGSGDRSTMPIHMADLGSDNWEQDFTLGLIANEEALVREIDEALLRIEDRTFGICVATQQPIGLSRLQAKPWAKYCIEYARLREEGRAP